ncbi:MAG: hypothetical protein DRH90_13125 [Deltaproteobacteria bacterium]|nr:MAG: hypothetical protein DRH90_13125 [Deltaproteobacteria bacterium]RLC18203.1 MAG: hypothetical protein DRI24_03670 [Deltaproteobacteria bacterium]
MNPSFKEKRRANKDPLPYTIYKGIKGKFGAVRFSLKKAYTDRRGESSKEEGCVFLDTANPKVSSYDWVNKITVKLDLSDIGKIIHAFRSRVASEKGVNIYHDKGKGTTKEGQEIKTINIYRSPEMDNFLLTIKENKFGKEQVVKTPISPAEALVIVELLQTAIPLVLQWCDSGKGGVIESPEGTDGNYSRQW